MESSSTKGNIRHGKLKSKKELKKITDSEEYKKSDYEGKTKKLNVATAKKGLASRTHGSDKPNKEIGKQSFKKKFSFSGKQMSDHYKARKSRTQSQSKMNPVPYLTGGQAKIAAKAPPPNKIDAKDFAVLRAEKAKGRGMGLQDEKVKPGKVQKAVLGLMFMKKAKKKGAKGAEFLSPLAMLKRISGKKRGGGIKIKKDPTKTVNPFEKKSSKFMERRKKLAGAQSALKVLGKAGKVGAILGAVGAAGAGAAKLGQTLGRKFSGTKKENKKMGGGMMMKRPMGYVKGGGMDTGGPKGKLMAYAKENMIKDKDRLTLRDKAMIKTVKNMDKAAYPAAERYYKKLTSTKKMGGGMIAPSQRPGYSKGTMIMARGCKLGRKKPTKIT